MSTQQTQSHLYTGPVCPDCGMLLRGPPNHCCDC